MLLNPFCPFSTAKVLALKATVLLLLTLLIKARVQIAAGSALGILLLLLQTLVPGVNYIGGSRQLRGRVGASTPLPWQGGGPRCLWGSVGG